ncbi:hypothetical protein HDU82_006163 [Entophlyctis luteolus]|nr:hypothetical protein HDU82_006163 [Entophlyctis luteolus]
MPNEMELPRTAPAVLSTKYATQVNTEHTYHRVKVSREADRAEYLKNKGRNGKAGELKHNYKELRTTVFSRKTTHVPKVPNDKDFDKAFQKQWYQYRMRKPQTDDSGRHYDILTVEDITAGREHGAIVSPHRGYAGRISIDKLNAQKYGTTDGERNFNIISNAPLPIQKD